MPNRLAPAGRAAREATGTSPSLQPTAAGPTDPADVVRRRFPRVAQKSPRADARGRACRAGPAPPRSCLVSRPKHLPPTGPRPAHAGVVRWAVDLAGGGAALRVGRTELEHVEAIGRFGCPVSGPFLDRIRGGVEQS